ncbi:hypothetical protein Tco_0546341 [Tanacetum coccineum]
MSDLKFANTYNLVAFLEKPTESEGFDEIVDFLNANPIKYALTVNPTIYLDKKKVIITKSTIRRDLQLEDANGVDWVPNAAIFEQLTLMGYEKVSQKLTFYKAFFSPRWKFLIHTILQCLSAKTNAWNEFSSTMASAIICLATNQKFNFSKYIFGNMVKNVDSMESKKKNTEVPQSSGSTDNVLDENVPTTSNDLLLSGEDRLKLIELMDLCTNLQKKVLDLEKAKTAQDSEIASLKKKVKKLERRNKLRTLGLKRLRKVGSARRVESSDEASLGDQEDASKQGRKIADIDADVEVTLIDETQGRNDDNIMFDTGVLDEQEVKVEKVVSTAKVTTKSATTTTVDELTMAQTLIEIKATKPKVRGVTIQEPNEFTTTTTRTTPAASKPLQDKGKAKMIESEKPLNKKDQIMYDQEVALRYTIKQLKGFKFEVIKDMFDKAFNRVNTFVDYKIELVEGSEKRAEDSTKRAGTELEQEVAKKQKIDDAKVDDDQE